MAATTLSGQAFDHCSACNGVWIPRTGILALRGAKGSDHAALQAAPGSRADPEAKIRCPSCNRPLESYRYRGGRVVVDKCPSCDHIFLHGGELRSVLDEWREGFEVAEGATAAIATSHAKAAARAFPERLAPRIIAGTIGISAATALIQELFWAGGSWLFLYVAVPGTLVAAGLWALGRADRRRRNRVLELTGKAEGALTGAVRSGEAARTASKGTAQTARCPWCRAKVPDGATYCKACESDII